MALNKKQDAYGLLVHDYFNGAPVTEIVERDDGFIAPSGGPVTYFAPYRKWPLFQQRAMAFVRGRVLDIGCGPVTFRPLGGGRVRRALNLLQGAQHRQRPRTG